MTNLDSPKLEEIADDNFIQVYTCLHYKSFENTAGKGENGEYVLRKRRQLCERWRMLKMSNFSFSSRVLKRLQKTCKNTGLFEKVLNL